MNIILIGMRGSGKSTIGKLLAKKLNKKFIDMDKLLVEREGQQLPAMISLHSWEYFRDKESEIAEEVSKVSNTVISTGGGVILRKKNINTLGNNGIFIFLKAPIAELIKRIGNGKSRPSLTGKKTSVDEMEEIWNERKLLYEKYADIIINTDDKTPNAIVEKIISILKEKQFNNETI